MKQLLLLLTITMATTLTANAQAKLYDAFNIKARTTLQLGNKTITEITDDTVMGNKYQAKIMSEWATKKAIENALQGIGVDTFVLATRLRLYKVKDSLGGIINTKLAITDTTNKWLPKNHTVNNISNGTGFLKNNGSGTWSYDSNTYATASSLNNYLPLTGGTLTGVLSGTNINISGKYTASNGTLDTPNTLGLFGYGGGETNRSVVIQNILNNSTSKQYLFLNGSLGSSSTVSTITTTSAYAGTFGFESTDNSLSILTASNGTNISPTRALTFTTGGNATFSGNITGGTFIKSGGTSSQFLKANGSVDNNSYTTLTSLSASAPISYDNTTGVFSMAKADTSTNGYLSSTDWNTFNNKQTALGFTPENVSNKKTTLSDNSDTYYPTQKAVKTAVDAKQDIITGGASTITSSNLTGDKALISNGSGKVAVSNTTREELDYVAGVTSNIQTQLNAKLTTAASNVKRYIRVDSTTYSGNYAMDGTKEVILINYADPCSVTLPEVSELPTGAVYEVQWYNWAVTNKTISINVEGSNSEAIDVGHGISSAMSSLSFKSYNQTGNNLTPLSLRIMWLAEDNVWTVLQGGVFDY